MKRASGYEFYNTSHYTFANLQSDPENIADNFRDYLNGFSENVQDILSRMNFDAAVSRMVEAGGAVPSHRGFGSDKADMSPRQGLHGRYGLYFLKTLCSGSRNRMTRKPAPTLPAATSST